MSHRVTINGKQRMAAIIIIPLSLLILLVSFWPEDSDKEVKEVRKAAPVVAKHVEKPSGLSTYGCGENVHIVAPVGRWSRETYQRIGCDFFFDRDPLPNSSSAERMRNWNSLLTARINGFKGPEMPEGKLPNGQYVDAYFTQGIDSMAFRSEEKFPIHVVVRQLQK